MQIRRLNFLLLPTLALLTLAAHAAQPEPAPLEAYAQLPLMDNPVLSPSGERYAFVATIDDNRRLFVRTVDGRPLAMASVDDVKLRGIRWAGENYVILTISETVNLTWAYGYDHELFQVVAIDLSNGEVRPLLQNPKVMNSAFGEFGYARRDGKWRAYLGALPMKRAKYTGRRFLERHKQDLIEVDLDDGSLRRIARSRERYAGWLVGPNGEILANEQYDDAKGDWRLYAGEGSGQAIARSEDPAGRNGILGRGRSPGTVLYVQANENGRRRFMEASLSGNGKPLEILRDENVRGLLFDPVTRLLNGFTREGSVPEPVLFDPADQARVDAARNAFPERSVWLTDASNSFDRMIVETQGIGDSGSWYLVDVRAGKAELLGHAYPEIYGERVGPVRTIRYRAADGLELEGVLTLPPGRQPENLPLVVLPHGGPEWRDHPRFDWLAQAFASRGYAVWQPNFRGSSGYGIEFRNAGNGEWGRKMQTDISDGVAELAKRGIVNANRACIVGASYGGYAALAGVTIQQGLYRCAVAVAGVSDLPEMLKHARNERRYHAVRYWRRFMGGDSFDETLHKRSPANLAKRADAPVLLIHGKDDTVVPIEQSEIMQDALEDAGKPVEMVVLDSEDHWLSHERTRVQLLQVAVSFVQRHLPINAP